MVNSQSQFESHAEMLAELKRIIELRADADFRYASIESIVHAMAPYMSGSSSSSDDVVNQYLADPIIAEYLANNKQKVAYVTQPIF